VLPRYFRAEFLRALASYTSHMIHSKSSTMADDLQRPLVRSRSRFGRLEELTRRTPAVGPPSPARLERDGQPP